jgi:hypothetical protein
MTTESKGLFKKLPNKMVETIGAHWPAELQAQVSKIASEIADQLPGLGAADTCDENLLDIHEIAEQEVAAVFPIEPLALKYPMPERPIRAGGLVHVDGRVYTAEKISRFVLLQIRLPFFVAVRSMFIRPRMEFDLPVFAAEVVQIGKKRMIILDIHRAGTDTGHDDEALFDQMTAIRDQYPSLGAKAIEQKGEIQSVFSRAACQAWITRDLDDDVMALFRAYLTLFLDLVKNTAPLTGKALEKTQAAYGEYLDKIVDHDPGVKGFKKLFGDQGGVERCLNIHFEQSS